MSSMVKKQKSIRLSDEGNDLLERLAKHYGIPQTSVIEMLLRDRARDANLSDKKDQST